MDRELYKERVKERSNEELAQWYRSLNIRVDDRRNSKKVEDSKFVLRLILEEFRQRQDKPNQEFITIPEIGLLKVMGYKVGIEGLKESARRRILKDVLKGHLPLVDSVAYMNEWGDPRSEKRFNKTKNCLLGFSNDPIHRSKTAALKDWQADLNWLLDNKDCLLSN